MSDRIYKRDLPAETVDRIYCLFNEFAFYKFTAHKMYVNDLRYKDPERESLFVRMRNLFPDASVYLLNTAMNEAVASQKACAESQKLNIKNIEQKLKNSEKRYKDFEDTLALLLSVKNDLKSNKLDFLENQKSAYTMNKDGSIAVKYGYKRKQKRVFSNLYDFEVQYIDVRVKEYKNNMGHLKFKIDRFKDKLKKLETYIPATQFGTRKLRKQGVTDKNKQKEYEFRRSRKFGISGRNDSKDGNYVFRYDGHSLNVVLNKETVLTLDVRFPYGQNVINSYYTNQRELINNKQKGKPVTYYIEDNGKYFTVKCVLDISKEVINYSTADGVIGVDTNLGFYAVCEINSSGSPLNFETIGFEWKDMPSGRVNANICDAAAKLVDMAVESHKPIVMEKLKFNTTGKVKDYNDNKTKNFNSHMFAYNKMLSAVLSRAARYGAEVFFVNPAYTSLIGKLKYMPYYKRSVHESAALVIGRRQMHFKEEIPKRLKPENKKPKEQTPENKKEDERILTWSDAYAKRKKIS